MNDDIKAGADINAGDGGYTESTKEKYDEFVKGRKQSLGKMRIRELAIEADIMAPTWNRVPLGYQRFAELIVRECSGIVQNYMSRWPEDYELTKQIKQHFGVEE
jgi:hypothetical protein